MEAIGQLAGGIAHDFNNLLTAIMGYSDLLLFSIDEFDPMRLDVKEIIAASQRASSLTRQLLAFSRKQVLQLQIIDLNEVLEDIRKLLLRLIGEHIELVTIAGANKATVEADLGQLEQVIINLAVNARDAMPNGGRLELMTINTMITEEATLHRHPDLKPGPYVLLSVMDNGSGMDSTIQNHLFEPFFTTKERGRGTGLGLSTVYGIVKQSGGHVEVKSVVGLGSTFLIYLPLKIAPVVNGVVNNLYNKSRQRYRATKQDRNRNDIAGRR